jgi:MFS family permease
MVLTVLDFLSNIRVLLSGLQPSIIFLVIFVFGMYVFWRGCTESRKNRSSVFDMFILSGIMSVLMGRFVYIVSEWEKFSSFIWYWLPYEKYGENIFLFRLLPWRFFSIWDGGLVILSMFVTLILVMTFYAIVIKNWRWKHMFFPIYFSATTMLGISFILTGFVEYFNEWIYKGLILIIVLAIFFILFKFISRIVKNPLTEKYILGYVGLLIVWLSTLYISYIYISGSLSLHETVAIGVFILWSFIMGVLFLFDLKKANLTIETRSSVRSVNSGNFRIK